jgi:hypothetical protein
MKKTLTIVITFILATNLNAQGVNDMVSMSTNYTNQVFYSFENGEVANISNLDWNIAFSLSGEGALGSSIILNEATSSLWGAPLDTNDWATFDSTGYASSWQQLLNSDTSWTNGAFNHNRGQDSFFDLGWGTLNPNNNYWTFGDSLYMIKLGDGSFKKLWIVSLKTGVWTFKYANPDGTNEVTLNITKADYTNKNFVYVSLQNDAIIDREPDNTTWDIMFSKHTDFVNPPGMYIGVTSVFNNVGLYTATSNEVDNAAALVATTPQTSFNQNTINIGRTWKKRVSGNWVVNDSIAYFAWNIDSTSLFRIVFTAFDGQSTGNAYFNIEKLGTVGLSEAISDKETVVLYPNPTSDNFTIKFTTNSDEVYNVNLFNNQGELVLKKTKINNTVNIDVQDLPKGIYFYQIISKSIQKTGKLIVQ